MRAADEVALKAHRVDLWALLSYLVLAVLVLGRLWRDPDGRVLSLNDDDHGVFLFFLQHGERVLFHGDNPFFTDRINVPDGVNMMANTSVLAVGLPLAPVTHVFGPAVSLVLALTLGLAGTAAAWYWVLSRHLVTSRVAAWIGGLWCGFAPAMVSHANGHVNFVSQFLVPFIGWQVLRLREPGRAWRGGVILGLLIVVQVFVNEEILLFTALTLAVFVLAYGIMARREAVPLVPRYLAGLGVAAGVAVVLLAYPLYVQFFGPQHYEGQPFQPEEYVTDLLSLPAFARQSLAGNAALAERLSVSATEENTFFGPAGLVMIIVAVVVLRRSVAARATAIAGLVLLVVSMGPWLRVANHQTPIPLPFGLVSHVPIIDLVSVTRFAMVSATVAGVLLALATDRVRDLPARRRGWFRVGLVLALVPLAPKPLPVVPADPLPAFVAQGMWREYVSEDRTLVPVPLPEVTTGRAGVRWSALAGLDVRTPRGYFMGPANPPGDLTGSWNAPRRFTSDLFRRVSGYGIRPRLTAADRQRIEADLRYWRADAVVLVPGSGNEDALRATLTDALGPSREVGGVRLWDVRYLAAPPQE